MTGPEHYKEAERLIAIAAKLTMETVEDAKENGAVAADMQVMAAHSANFLAEAQVHATLAHAAAQIGCDFDVWLDVLAKPEAVSDAG